MFVFYTLKVDYYNPVVKAFVNFYSPISKISIFSNQVYTIFLLAVLLKFSGYYLLYSSQYDEYVLGMISVIEALNGTLTVFFFCIIGSVILSWIAPGNPHPLLKLVEDLLDKINLELTVNETYTHNNVNYYCNLKSELEHYKFIEDIYYNLDLKCDNNNVITIEFYV